MAVPSWTLVEYRGLDGLERLEADWRRLYGEMSNPAMWHSIEVNRSYVENLCPSPERFRSLALRDEHRVRAILPIEERRERALGLPIRVWGMPLRDGWKISDAIGVDDEALRALIPLALEFLGQQPGRPSILVLGRTPDSSVMWSGLASLKPPKVYTFLDGAAYTVATDLPAEDFVKQRMSSKSRRAIRADERLFFALPDAHYIRARGREQLAEEFERFLDVEASGWKGAQGTAIRLHPELVGYYRGLMTSMVADGRCEIHSLHAQGRCIASEFNVYTGRQCAGPKAGYDEQYARMAPGRLVVHKTIEWCCDDPDVDVVNEISDAEWLRMWRPNPDGLRRAYVSLRPLTGITLLLALRFRFGPLRRVVRDLKARRMRWRRRRDSRRTNR